MKPDFDNPDLFSFDDCYASLAFLSKMNNAAIGKIKKTHQETREFCQTYLRPLVLSTDLELQKKPDTLATELMDLAVKHHRITRNIPRAIGGTSIGSPIFCSALNMEETASVDSAFAGMLGGNDLGFYALLYSFNFRLLDWVVEQMIQAEDEGWPYLMDCAITEPSAGTDVEEMELLPHAKLVSEAKKVDGGVLLNGRKVFISTGHFAKIHFIILPFNRKDPTNTMGVVLVQNDTPGFSLGKLENKMGQKAGPASELIFEDCFIPDKFIVTDPYTLPKETHEGMLHSVLGASRIVVGAWGVGMARNAFEISLQFAKKTKWKGRTIIQQQWAQEALTDMLTNVYKGRSVYLEAIYALLQSMGMSRIGFPGVPDARFIYSLYSSPPIRKLRHHESVRKMAIKNVYSNNSASSTQRIQFYSSLAKVVGTDIGMENCHRAIELMGAIGCRHDSGAEKVFRDAKLNQIFEGTNQLNRLNMFKHFVARNAPDVEVF